MKIDVLDREDILCQKSSSTEMYVKSYSADEVLEEEHAGLAQEIQTKSTTYS